MLNGGADDDILDGGADADELTGGDGMDTFVFAPDHADSLGDIIIDFSIDEEDKIDLSAFGDIKAAAESGRLNLADLTSLRGGNNVEIDLSEYNGGGTISLQFDNATEAMDAEKAIDASPDDFFIL